MASLMDIGRSAVTAQREALNVTGQNIANIETKGYRRRDASLTEVIGNQSELTAKTSQTGLGVQLSDVQRAFNSYLTDSSRSATSRFEAADTFESKIVQLENLLLPREGDLGTMMNAFFGEMSGIAALPGDMAPRAAGLAQGSTLAASFNNTANVLQDLADAAFGELQSKVEEVNLLTAALGAVNGRLRSSNLGGTPPNMLLDERDRLIDEISERMNVTVAVGERYEAEVFIGSSEMGPNLVSGERVTPMTTLMTSEKAVKFKLGTNTFISNIQGGAISGLNDALMATQAAISDLDALARKITTDMNKQHQQGIDLEGELGGAMFTAADFELNAGVQNRGDSTVTLNKIPGQVDVYDYIEFTYSAASNVWTGRDGDGAILGSGRTQLQLEGGMVEFSGKPKDGDSFQMSRVSGDASRMSFLLTRAEQFAAASTLKITINAGNEGTGNLSTSIASVPSSGLPSVETVLKNLLSPVAATDFIRDGVVAVIPANISDIEFASLNKQPTMRVATADISQLQNVAFQLDGTTYSFDVDATEVGETAWQHGGEIANSLNDGVIRAVVDLGSTDTVITSGTGFAGMLIPVGATSSTLTATIDGVSVTATTVAGTTLEHKIKHAKDLTDAINNNAALIDKGITAKVSPAIVGGVSANINVQVVGSSGVTISSLGLFASGFEGGVVLASGGIDDDSNAKAFSNATFRLSGGAAQTAETNAAQVASDIQIFTREGRQISGDPLTAGQAAALLTPLNGFVSGAEYRADYLTADDGIGYRGMSVDTFQAEGLKRRDLPVSSLGSIGTNAELISQARTSNPSLTPSSNVNAQTITVKAANGSERRVTIPSGVASDYVAEQLSAELSPLGINVSSHTRASIKLPSGIQTGTIGFDISGTNIVPVSVATSVSSGDLTSLAEAINYRSSVTGVSATLTNDSKNIVLDHSTGADIFISNIAPGSINMDVSVLDGNYQPFVDIDFDVDQYLAFSGTTQPIAEVAAEVTISGVNFASAAITSVESSTGIADDGYTIAFDAAKDKVTVTGAPTGAGTLAVALTDANGHILKAKVTVDGDETRDQLAAEIDAAIDTAKVKVVAITTTNITTTSNTNDTLTLGGGGSFTNINAIASTGAGEAISLSGNNKITVTTPASSTGTISFDLVDTDGNSLSITTASIAGGSTHNQVIVAIKTAIDAAKAAASNGLTTDTKAGSDYIAANSGPIKKVVDDVTNITKGTGNVITVTATSGSLEASIEGTVITVAAGSSLQAGAASFASAVNTNASLMAMGIKAVAASDSTGQVRLYYKNTKSLSQNTRITGQLSMTSKSGFDLQSNLTPGAKVEGKIDPSLGGLVSRSFTKAGTSASLKFAANVEIDGAATNVDGTKAQAPSAFYDVKLDAVGGPFDVNISSGEIGETSSALIAAGIAEKMRSQAPVPSITGVPIASLPPVGTFARFSIGDAEYTLERDTKGLKVSGPEEGRVFINTENVFSGGFSTTGEPVLLGQSITLSVNSGSLTGHAPAPLFDDNASLFGFGVGANYSTGSDKFSLVDPKVTHKAKSVLQGRDFAIPTNLPANSTLVSTSATVTGGNNLALEGGGTVTLGTGRQITITSAGNDSDKTFTISGTDADGNSLTEVVTGANAAVATSTHYFKTITSIDPSANPSGATTAGVFSNGVPTQFTAIIKDTAINVTLTNNFNPTSVLNITIGTGDTYNQLTVPSSAGSDINFGISFMGGRVSGTYAANVTPANSSADLNARAVNLADAINANSAITNAGGLAVASTNGTGLVVIEGALNVVTNETVKTSSPSSNIAMRQVSEISVTGATFSTAAFTSALPANATLVSTSATVTGGNNLALVGGGTVTLGTGRQITITSAGNDSDKTFTITGTDANGNDLTEIVTGALAGAVATSTNYFKTITSIDPSVNPAGATTAGVSSNSDAGYSVAFDTSDNKITVTGAPTGAGTLALAFGHGDGSLKTSVNVGGSETREQLAAAIETAMDAAATSLNRITTTENTGAGTVQLGGVASYTAISSATANGVTAGMSTGGLISVTGSASADGTLSLDLIDGSGHELEVAVAYLNNDTRAQITTKIGAAIDAAKAAVTVGTTATNATLVSSSATVSGGNNLALVGGGTVTLSASRQITITSAGNDSNKTFTITGTDADGNALIEVVTGANAAVATSTNYFKTITSIDPSAQPAGATTAGIIVDDKITLTPSNTSDATITIEGVTVTATGISDARFKFDANGILDKSQEAGLATQKNNYASQFALAINENAELAALGLSAVPSVDGSGDINVSRLSVSLTPASGPTAIQLKADLASGPIQVTGGASATTLGFKVAEADLLVTEDGLTATSLNGLPVDFSGSGTSLAETRTRLTGLPTEELIVVVAGGGSRRISAKYTIDADIAVDPLKKEQQYQVKMLDANSGRVELFDKATGHSIATRISNGNAQFDADGLRFNLNGYANTGDSFDVLTGQKAAGDARNMDEIMILATSTVSRSSFQDDFRSIAASVGSTLSSSRLSKLSAEAVRDAAVAAEDEVSGVNMDEEAAKLITQQQAYQAAARILQTAKEMFDTLMQIR